MHLVQPMHSCSSIRAMENLSYARGVNRIGKDGNELEYLGGSMGVDYLGLPINPPTAEAGIIHCELDLEALKKFREKFPTGLDADSFNIQGIE